MNRPAGSTQYGFTLLELLVAIGITAMLVTTAVQAYIEIQHVIERARGGGDREHAAGVLLDRIAKEIQGTLLIRKQEGEDRLTHPWLFIGDDRVLGDSDADALRFITRTPARVPATESSAGLRMVTYGLGPRADQGMDLLRKEMPLPQQMERQINLDDAQVVGEQLARFSLRYENDETGDWEDRWDSTDIARLDRLPTALEISVQLLRSSREGTFEPGPLHTRVVRLRVRPFQSTPEAPEAPLPGAGPAPPQARDPNGN